MQLDGRAPPRRRRRCWQAAQDSGLDGDGVDADAAAVVLGHEVAPAGKRPLFRLARNQHQARQAGQVALRGGGPAGYATTGWTPDFHHPL